MSKDDIETVVWVIGIAVFVAGCGITWGYPAAMIAGGGIFSFWPLVKQFGR